MQVKKNVHSGNLTFKQLEVNVDTVFYRFNERKWYEKDEETGKEEHIGWIYDEIWYEKDSFIEKLSEENNKLNLELGKANMELYTTMAVMEEQHKLENAKQLMNILQLISIMGGEE